MAEDAFPARVVASAPGKLFLLGEYAVLHGAPALLTAVDRRATVTAEPADRFTVTAANLHLDVTLNDDGSLPGSLDAADRDRLRVFDAVRRTIAAETGPLPPLAVRIDSSAFWQDGNKLGLGSSAAVAAALTAALARVAGLRLTRDELCERSIRAHRASQGGTGSGGDVAASVYGGLISYTPGSPAASLPWPEEVTLMVVVTGTGSSTPELVGRVAAYGEREPDRHRVDFDRLARLAGRAPAALGSADAFLALAADYFDALAQLDEHAGAGIISDRHRRLHEIAAGAGAVFKSSGAGGGDVGLVFCRTDRSAAVVETLQREGADPIPLGFAAAGVQDGVSP